MSRPRSRGVVVYCVLLALAWFWFVDDSAEIHPMHYAAFVGLVNLPASLVVVPIAESVFDVFAMHMTSFRGLFLMQAACLCVNLALFSWVRRLWQRRQGRAA